MTRITAFCLSVMLAGTLATPLVSLIRTNFTGSVSVAMQTERMNIYYVAPNGSDSNSGTETQPFRTMKRGVSVLKPGDTLYVKNGTYIGSSQLAYMPGGTSWSAPVTIAAYPGHRPVIVPEPGNDAMYFVGNQYIMMDGFIFDAAGGNNGIKITWETGKPAAHHIRIKNSEVKNAAGQGILMTGADAQFNEFINLNVHHIGVNCYEPGRCHGIYISTDNNLIDGGTYHDNQSYGIHIYSGSGSVGPSNNIVRNAFVYNNRTGIGLMSGVHNRADKNVVYANKLGIWLATTEGMISSNMVFNNSDSGILVGFSRNTVSSNIIYSNGNGLEVYQHAGPVSGVVVRNNRAAMNRRNFNDNTVGGVIAQGNLFGDAHDSNFVDLSKP